MPPAIRSSLERAVPVVVVLLVASPLLVTTRAFSADLPNHLWVISQQMENIRDLGHPSIYLQSSIGAYFPWFAFYGGVFYTLAGGLAAVFDSPTAGMIAILVLGMAMALGGWSWLAHQLGLRGWAAHAPGVLYVTSAYYVSNIYGRGDLPEAVATSCLPLCVAAAAWLVRAPAWRPAPVAAFLFATVLVTGTHPITTLWGVTFLAPLAVVALAAWGRPQRATLRRLAGVAGLGVLALGINAWFLVITGLHHGDVMISNAEIALTDDTRLAQLIDPLRHADAICCPGSLAPELPVLALAWAAVAALLVGRRASRGERRWAVGLVVVLGALFVLMVRPTLTLHMPRLWRFLEFPFRLDTYAVFCIAGLVALGLWATARVAARPGARALKAGLGAILVLGAVQAVVQAFGAVDSLPDRSLALASSSSPPRQTWYIRPDYADASRPVVRPSRPGRLTFDVRGPRRDAYVARVPAGIRGSQTVATNLAVGPYLVDLEGAEPAGRTRRGDMVVRLDARGRGDGTVRAAGSRAAYVRVGRAVTLVSLVVAFALLGGIALRARRQPTRRTV